MVPKAGYVTKDIPYYPYDGDDGDVDDSPGHTTKRTKGAGQKDSPGCDSDRDPCNSKIAYQSLLRSYWEVRWLEERLCQTRMMILIPLDV